ncbi:hypothetical protein Y032_0021g439 [Ancylostoma ceylanicum]|uniref:Chromo domain-containing protein n=2 Tax=Ancylostoma ceylanicum TaxID=53326 RepID=A0A016V236_9BILA|nr:hypothetical protein Y032_0021g439 [Ancylostoma ceylanicum]
MFSAMGRDKKKEEDEDSGDDVYVVEAVINKRKAKDGKVEYLLKWQVCDFVKIFLLLTLLGQLVKRCVVMHTNINSSTVILSQYGFPLEESTWEPEENVACHELIAEFERKRSKVEKKEPSAASEKREEKQLHRIIGLTDSPGELHFLIKWKDHTADLVPAKEANVKYPQEVIRFYEERLKLQAR